MLFPGKGKNHLDRAGSTLLCIRTLGFFIHVVCECIVYTKQAPWLSVCMIYSILSILLISSIIVDFKLSSLRRRSQ